jgi:hypothetical protein
VLVLSSERAFARLASPGGYWDQQSVRSGSTRFFGNRGSVLANILTSTLFKTRLEDVSPTWRSTPRTAPRRSSPMRCARSATPTRST